MKNTISSNEIVIRVKDNTFKDLILIKETRSDGEIWFKVPNSVSSPNIDLVIEDLNKQVSNLKNSCDEDEIILLNHFKNFIKEIAEYHLKNGAIITKDNVHLYYEFMSQEDIQGRFKQFITKEMKKAS